MAGVLVGAYVIGSGGDPARFLALGEQASTRDHVQTLLQRQIPLRAGSGHDGAFYLIQAGDPWITDPSTAQLMDYPRYRARRMLFPVLASAGGAIRSPNALLVTLPLVSVLAGGVGSWALSRISVSAGLSPWIGLFFVVVPANVNELLIGGPGVLALACALAGIVASESRRPLTAGIALGLAVLAKETMIVFLVAAVWVLLARSDRRSALLTLASSLSPLLFWVLYVELAVSTTDSLADVSAFGAPLAGLFTAATQWGFSDVLTFAAVVSLIPFAFRSRLARSPLGVAAWLVVLGSVFFSSRIWNYAEDFTRALGPVMLAGVLALAASAQVRFDDEPRGWER